MNDNNNQITPRGGGGRGGRGGGPGGGGRGPAGTCLCPNCGTEVPHDRGIPCMSLTCPKCSAVMVRGQ